MKLRQAIKMVAAGAAVTASASVLAAPSVGGFSSSAGTISASCPSGYTCSSSPISEAGFFQRQLTEDSTGRTFIQTILTEGDQTGGVIAGNSGFSDESFVEVGGGEGLINQQKIAERVTGAISEDFNSTTNLLLGTFRPTDANAIDITQTIIESDSVVGDSFGAGFRLQEADASAFGGNITAKVQLYADVLSGEFTSAFAMETYVVEDTGGTYASAGYKTLDVDQNVNTADIVQDVAFRERTGAAVTSSGYTTGGGSFSAGDTMIKLEIGQTVTGAGQFGLDDFANESTGTAVGIDSLTSAGVPFQSAHYGTNTNGADPFAAMTGF